MQLIPCHHESQLWRLTISFKKYCTGNYLLCLPFLFSFPKQPTACITAYFVYSCSYLSPPSSPSSHHPRFLPVYGTTLCMINWYGWISKYEALTKLCKLTDHVFTMPVMLVNKHSSKSTINTTQVDPTKSVKKNKMCNYPFICIVVETRDGMWSQKYICQPLFVPPFPSFLFRCESKMWRMWSLKIHLFNFE